MNNYLTKINVYNFARSDNPDERSLWWCWRNILNRCNLPTHKNYENYGGRGIECRFNTFEDFVNYVGFRPSSGLSLDRVDNNGHYEVR
jgi:hypothetical protein